MILTIPLIKSAIPISKIRNLILSSGFKKVNIPKAKIAAPNTVLAIRDFFDKEGHVIPVKILSTPTIDKVTAIKSIIINGSISAGFYAAKIDKIITILPSPICVFLIHLGTETSCIMYNITLLFI
jgi:hypothetical protein